MSKQFVNKYIKFVRGSKYMDGVERDNTRIKESAEIFTPTPIVKEILDWYSPETFSENQEFVDIACGDGQFLIEIVIKKLEMGLNLEEILKQTYGSDIMIDNVVKCRQRLAGPNPPENLIKILETQIVCANALDTNHDGWKSVGYMWQGKSFLDFG